MTEKFEEVKAAVEEKTEEIKTSHNWKEIGKGVLMGAGTVIACIGIYKLAKYVGSVQTVAKIVEPVAEAAPEVLEEVAPEVVNAVA